MIDMVGPSVIGRAMRAAARIAPATQVILLARHGLKSAGWIESHRRGSPVDATGCPIPWLTYPSIHFLEQRITPLMKVFEYGAGSSTHWWAARVEGIVSCEHDQTWADRVADSLPSNATLMRRSLGGGYAEAIRGLGPFDVVVVDGRDRARCAEEAVTELADNGVIVWDNTNRERYRSGMDSLTTQGFRRIDFFGFIPMGERPSITSIFYRPDNC